MKRCTCYPANETCPTEAACPAPHMSECIVCDGRTCEFCAAYPYRDSVDDVSDTEIQPERLTERRFQIDKYTYKQPFYTALVEVCCGTTRFRSFDTYEEALEWARSVT